MFPRTAVRLLVMPLLALLVVAGLATPATANEEFRFEGSGWGHGIGMSQYGAHGKGLAGDSYTKIISHYYQGAGVGEYQVTFPLLIGLMQYVGDPVVTSHPRRARFVSRRGTSTLAFGGTDYTMGQDETWRLEINGTSCALTGPSVSVTGACNATIKRGSGARIEIPDKGDTYRRGVIHVRPAGDHPESPPRFRGFHVTLQIPMEQYLLGLAEMPDSFHIEALKTQVVAARSYAAHAAIRLGDNVSRSASRRDACWCHLFDDIRNQVYRGNRSAVKWPEAVQATEHRVIQASGSIGTQDGVVQAFYSSSSGGKTENKDDIWGGARYPYLVTVDDRWAHSSQANNPFSSWAIQVPTSTVASRVGLDTVTRIEVTARHASGSARTVSFTGTKDGKATTVTRTGTQARTLLGLRSAYIHRALRNGVFLDVDGNTHEANIVWIADQGITRGCNPPTNDRYCPGASVTRAQMAAFIVRALGLTDTSSSGTFRDVPADSTFATAINRLATAGITRGCNPPANDRFCPDDLVTRAQMAAFIVRALGLTDTSSSGTFRDVPADSTFATAINRLATAGITRGCNPPTNDRYCPGNDVKRDQMASFLARALK